MAELPNWFSNDGQVNFEFYLLPLAKTKQNYLQIGAYTGDASTWLYENVLASSESTLVDVDTWEGSEEPVHYEMDWRSIEEVYDDRTKQAREVERIFKYKGTSDEFFKQNTKTFDFIYVDGDHTAYGVVKDAVNSFECLNQGGILAFDDYQWSAGLGELKEPRPAVDAFWSVYKDKLEVLFVGYQCWFRKL
jgi:hypothetical protein